MAQPGSVHSGRHPAVLHRRSIRYGGQGTVRHTLSGMLIPPEIPHVPFTAQQATGLGITRACLRHLVAARLVRRMLRGVYQRSELPDDTRARARATALVTSKDTVVTDRTAAWIWEVDAFRHSELEILPPVEVCVVRGGARVRRRGCCGGERDLQPYDICEVEGVRLTTPLRTALDLGCRLGRWEAIAALDGFMRVCGVTRTQLESQLPRYFRRRGVVQLRGLVPLADPRAESTGESRARLAIADAGIPLPRPQYWVTDEDGEPLFRLDLAYPLSKVCVEYDGREYHSSDEQRAHDRERRRWLTEHGWTVIVLDKTSFSAEALAVWRPQLRAALGLVG